MYKDLMKKFIQFSIGNWITIFISLITTPLITRIFMPEEYGKFSMFNLVVNLLLLIILMGTDQSYMRFYSTSKGATLFRKCLKGSILMLTVVSLLLILAGGKLSFLILEESNSGIIVLIVLGLLFQVVLKFLQIDVRMRQNATLYSTISIVDKVSNVILTLLFAKILGNGYLSLILAFVISNVVVIIMIVLMDKGLSFKQQSNESIKYIELIKYGLPFMTSLLVFWLFESFDKFALKYLSNNVELGIYAASMKLVLIFNIIQNSFMNFWTPVSLEYYEKKEDAKKFFKDMFELVGFILLILGTVVILFSDVSTVLLGDSYRASSNVLPFLIFIPIFYTVSETTVMGINFLKKTKWHLLIAACSSIVNIGLNLLVVPSFGAKGAAFSTAIGYLVFFVMRTIISNRLYRVDYNLSKFLVSILVLFLYAGFAAFTEMSLLHLLLGVLCISIITYCYRKYINKILIYFRQTAVTK